MNSSPPLHDVEEGPLHCHSLPHGGPRISFCKIKVSSRVESIHLNDSRLKWLGTMNLGHRGVSTDRSAGSACSACHQQ